MQVVNYIRANVLGHSSAAKKMGDHNLADRIVSIKQTKNTAESTRLTKENTDLTRVLRGESKKDKITSLTTKIQRNKGKLVKLEKKQQKYNSISTKAPAVGGATLDAPVFALLDKDKILENQLIEHFGPERAQGRKYTGDPVITKSEHMAIGLYTSKEYSSLNPQLRSEFKLDEGASLIERGLSSVFEKTASNEKVLKTFRGTTSARDDFLHVAEGVSGHEAGYMSTTLDIEVAREFSRKVPEESIISTIFGHTGLDVSKISRVRSEQEVLYNKKTEMNVLFSGRDKYGRTHRALEESNMPVGTGRQKGLVDALDLPLPLKKPSRLLD